MLNDTEKAIFKESDSTAAEIIWSNMHRISRHAKDLSYSALTSVATTQRLRGLGLSTAQVALSLPTMEIDGTALSGICPVNSIVECVASKYRTLSGHCNNVNYPLRGAVYEPMQRFLKPDYADEVSAPRASTIGASLPNARRISRELINEPQDVHNACAMMAAQWGMFIYEDIAQIGAYRIFKEAPVYRGSAEMAMLQAFWTQERSIPNTLGVGRERGITT
uniref:Uncharacterized protein n=1 Tax=Parascaris univalens TaxID=6257 RepID=A0A914ZVB7_PARUN